MEKKPDFAPRVLKGLGFLGLGLRVLGLGVLRVKSEGFFMVEELIWGFEFRVLGWFGMV